MEVQTPPQPTPPPPHLNFPDSPTPPLARGTPIHGRATPSLNHHHQAPPHVQLRRPNCPSPPRQVPLLRRRRHPHRAPNEDLDSLVSVTTDEDLENMIDEYDHRTSSKPSRIRLFLFPIPARLGPDYWARVGPSNGQDRGTAQEFEAGAGGSIRAGFADAGDEFVFRVYFIVAVGGEFAADIKVRVEDGGNGGGEIRAQDQKVVGIEEQFAQLGVGGVVQKQDEGFGALSSSSAATVVVSDDERSENGVPVGSQPVVFDLPSPDSVSSDSSLSNPMSRPKPVIYQDQVQIQSGTSWVPTSSVDPKLNVSDQHGQFQMHQQHVHDRGYVLQQQQFDQQQQAQPQQQFIHGTHLIHQHTPAYYTVYQHQQQQLHPQHPPSA
ncbi:PB1 domain [Sesbania bispinosa]|nr:PB1 domain [Sesbania bispinosa]